MTEQPMQSKPVKGSTRPGHRREEAMQGLTGSNRQGARTRMRGRGKDTQKTQTQERAEKRSNSQRMPRHGLTGQVDSQSRTGHRS